MLDTCTHNLPADGLRKRLLVSVVLRPQSFSAGEEVDIQVALNSTDPERLWHWELRSMQHLRKQLQSAGRRHRKALQDVGLPSTTALQHNTWQS